MIIDKGKTLNGRGHYKWNRKTLYYRTNSILNWTSWRFRLLFSQQWKYFDFVSSFVIWKNIFNLMTIHQWNINRCSFTHESSFFSVGRRTKNENKRLAYRFIETARSLLLHFTFIPYIELKLCNLNRVCYRAAINVSSCHYLDEVIN